MKNNIMCKEYMSGMLLWISAVIISILSVYGIVNGHSRSMTLPEQTIVDQTYVYNKQQNIEFYKTRIAEIESKIQNTTESNKIKELNLQKKNLENKIFNQ